LEALLKDAYRIALVVRPICENN